MLLMTPAAVHRIAFNGADDEGFYRLGSGLVIAAAAPLAVGIAADVAVVFYKITGSAGITAAAGGAAFALLAGVWFAWPAWLRARS
jgi:membrane associated rhomboid family serine protease